MINIDPKTGDTSGVALKVLAGYRRQRANILFGQFLALDATSTCYDLLSSTYPGRRPTDADDEDGNEVKDGSKFAEGVVGGIRGVLASLRGSAIGGDDTTAAMEGVEAWKAWVWEGMMVSGDDE